MRDTITKQTIDHFMLHSWFFFKLIAKSMAYYAQQHHDTPREDRFPEVRDGSCVGDAFAERGLALLVLIVPCPV